MQAGEWIRRVERAGLSSILVPLLETTRALGFVAAQALLLGQPLLSGLVQKSTLHRAVDWLEDPQQMRQWLHLLEEEEGS